MARGRPKGSKFDKHDIRVKVWKALKSEGHTLPLLYERDKSGFIKSRLIRGQHRMKVAVAAVAKDLKCSETTVWNAWGEGFDPWSYELQQEKYQSDFEWDIYYEYRRDAALGSLQREFGNRAEFTEEEIEE